MWKQKDTKENFNQIWNGKYMSLFSPVWAGLAFGILTFIILGISENSMHLKRAAQVNDRHKRFVIMTSERELRLPPGTSLSLEFTAGLPGFNPLPTGVSSETAFSIPFDVNFDDLGLTSEENTFGNLMIVDVIKELFSTPSSTTRAISGGGERSVFYQIVEQTLRSFGINGKACLLRTICEVHATPLYGYGLLGEAMHLLLTVSGSENMLNEYLEAEMMSKRDPTCFKYTTTCPYSLFGLLSGEQVKTESELHRRFARSIKHEEEINNNETSTLIFEEDQSALNESEIAHSRQKRFFFFGPAGNIRLPGGAVFVWKPQISLPWATNLPDGYSSGLSIGIPLKVSFDDLGFTTGSNPFLNIPFLRKKRDTWRRYPGVNYSAGDREIVYAALEDGLEKFGLEGKDCLLRSICEVQNASLKNYGLFGELVKAFLTPSKSLHSEARLGEYVEAERVGKKEKLCFKYYPRCNLSVFK